MNTENSLSRMALLLEAAHRGLGKVAHLKNDERVPVLNLALADINRTLGFWRDERAEGMNTARVALIEATERLASAMRVKSPQDRAQVSDIAHKRVITALREIETTLAKCREEVADAGA